MDRAPEKRHSALGRYRAVSSEVIQPRHVEPRRHTGHKAVSGWRAGELFPASILDTAGERRFQSASVGASYPHSNSAKPPNGADGEVAGESYARFAFPDGVSRPILLGRAHRRGCQGERAVAR